MHRWIFYIGLYNISQPTTQLNDLSKISRFILESNILTILPVLKFIIHCTWQVVLPEKFCAKQMVLKNVIRTYWGMQKSKMQNHIMCPLRGLVQHRPKNPPNLGRMGCLCQLLSPKGHMIWFLFFHYTFPVAKWVRKYPPCALHKTFLVRCLRKYSV